ncbi:hypothetical protein CYMTET_56047 [Cymbomonas tetramitiformis]|uniref:Uncharacterized protein n=1 Tax=Cymbomonas tetramitiformis TaxID=36881 RepID=A0AAE0BD32_9CHLO|nr:hypothetical protein CYMTET_56047 [Cymbomonas tetramitiformis]
MDQKPMPNNVPELQALLHATREQLDREKKRNHAYIDEIQKMKEQNLAFQNTMELEEEAITNKLMKRLSQLKQEKQTLANQVEEEEEFLTNNLQKRLQQLHTEKVDLEKQLETEQEYIVNKLQKQLDELARERSKLTREKVDLENQLEAEQEYIVNKLQKQVQSLALEKTEMKSERDLLKQQVKELGAAKVRLHSDKCSLENQMEAEEENMVNRLQRQLEDLAWRYMILERRHDHSYARSTTCSESETDMSEDEGSVRGDKGRYSADRAQFYRANSRVLAAPGHRAHATGADVPGKPLRNPPSADMRANATKASPIKLNRIRKTADEG